MDILGIKVDQTTYQEALQKSKELLDSGGKYYIVTPNPEMVVAAQSDSEFKEILNKADLSLADGVGLVKMARLSGKNLPERISGVDFVEGLASLAEEFGYAVFLLGGREGVAKRAAKCLQKRYPQLKIVGVFSGDAGSKFDQQTRKAIGTQKIDILAVSFGAPRQEKWIARNLPNLNVKLAIGVGGALDYISGSKRRAPEFIQKANLEWLYRLISEPWRIKRQLALPYFAYLVFKEKLSSSRSSKD